MENTKIESDARPEDSGSPARLVQVDLKLLDRLMDLAGELVLSRNQLLQGMSASNVEAMKASGQRIDIITSELQETIMKTRNLPNAIIPCQIIEVGKERFALPQEYLTELVRIPGDQVRERIETVGDAEVVRLRGEILPLLNLAALLCIEQKYEDPQTGLSRTERRKKTADRRSGPLSQLVPEVGPEEIHAGKDMVPRKETDRRSGRTTGVNIAVVSDCGFKYGLVVDRFLETEEVVVKSLGRHLDEYQAYSGATIMGDGKVALILDILNLARMAGLSEVSEAVQALKSVERSLGEDGERKALLTFRNGPAEHFAVPLDLVRRIERIESSDIEAIGQKKVVQYRGGTLELFELSQLLEIQPLPAKSLQEVIVLNTGTRDLGLMVTGPVDALETVLAMDETSLKQPGIHGSMTIHQRTTLLIDVAGLEKIISSL